MIEYIATKLPSDMQIILAVEEPTKFKFEKVIELNEPYNLLSPDQYDQIRKFIDPFTDAMYRALLG